MAAWSYFGGLGAGRGWRKCYFLIGVEELREVMRGSGCELLVTNSRVPVDYVRTEIEEYLAGYAAIFREPAGKESELRLHISMLLPGARYEWEAVKPRRKRDEGFKLVDLREPVVNLRPLHVMWGGDGRLHFGWDSPENVLVGLEMNFPEVVSYTSERHEVLHETEQMLNAALFDLICEDVMRKTKPAVIATPAGERKTRVRVSDAGVGVLADQARFRERGMRLMRPSEG